MVRNPTNVHNVTNASGFHQLYEITSGFTVVRNPTKLCDKCDKSYTHNSGLLYHNKTVHGDSRISPHISAPCTVNLSAMAVG